LSIGSGRPSRSHSCCRKTVSNIKREPNCPSYTRSRVSSGHLMQSLYMNEKSSSTEPVNHFNSSRSWLESQGDDKIQDQSSGDTARWVSFRIGFKTLLIQHRAYALPHHVTRHRLLMLVRPGVYLTCMPSAAVNRRVPKVEGPPTW
jgi:hypothetical protein